MRIFEKRVNEGNICKSEKKISNYEKEKCRQGTDRERK